MNIESDFLSNEILIDTIINGHYNKDQIIKSIECSRHFAKPESKGPWFTIMNLDSVKTDEIDKAIAELNEKFENLQITEKGEILHSINILFMLSDIGHIDKSINDVYLFFLEYVRRLQNNNNFPPADVFTEHYPIQDSAYGYGFWIKDSYRHYSVQLNKILERQQYISLRKKYPSFLIEIKRNLKEDTEKFCEQISRNGIRETNIYGYIGILSSFKPYEFVDMWLSIEITKWHSVREALVNRYSGGSLQGDLVEEREWLKNIKVNIKHRASKLHGIDKLRILRLMMGL